MERTAGKTGGVEGGRAAVRVAGELWSWLLVEAKPAVSSCSMCSVIAIRHCSPVQLYAKLGVALFLQMHNHLATILQGQRC